MARHTRWLGSALGLVFWLWVGAAVAQPAEAVPVDLDKWEATATQGEAAVDDRNITDAALAELRSKISTFRAEFDTARGQNGDRIASLREQIKALGAAPAKEGDTVEAEPSDVVNKRAALEQQLAAALGPVQVAEAAFRRADGLIGEIDSILRERQTNELLTKSVSPLNVALWPGAIVELGRAISDVRTEAITTAKAPRDKGEEAANTPLIIGAGLLGLLLVVRGRQWARKIVSTLRRRGARGLGVWRFVVSLLRIILPLAGLSLIVLVIVQAGIFGENINELLLIIPFAGAFLLGFRWVSERVFSADDEEALILLPAKQRRQARRYIYAITLCIVVDLFFSEMLDNRSKNSDALTVLGFPITVLTAIFLFQLSRLLLAFRSDPTTLESSPEATDGAPEEDDSEDTVSAPSLGTMTRVVRGFGTAGLAVSVAAPLLHAAGYVKAADSLLGPFITTLILMGLVMVLQRLLADVYGVITGIGVQARDALMPIVFGMVLFLVSLPMLALVWGARLTDLTEAWGLFLRGFSLGETRISPTDFLAFAAIFVVGYFLTKLVQGALRSNVLPKTKLDIGGQNAIVSGIGYVGIFLAVLVAITGAGIDLSSFAIVAGALSVGIGFGLQNIVSNFVAGIILLIERPISEGDWIEVGGQMGYVRDISVRSTRIETFDRTDVIVPNADLVSGTVTNYTRGNTVGRVIIDVGVAYGSDTRQVEAILTEIAEAQPMVLVNPPPSVVFMGIGASTYDFQIRAILRDVNWMLSVKSDINHEIVRRMGDAGIEMAFPQQDIWLRNPEALKDVFSQ